MLRILLIALLLGGGPVVVRAADVPTAQEMNNSNNPLTPAIGVNLQDQYVASYYGLRNSDDTNSLLLRGVVPHRLFGWPQIIRATIPIATSMQEETGLGDINVFDLFLFKAGPVALGAGPEMTFPSANDDAFGTGKWQAGAALAVVAPQPWGLLGGLVTYQHSFAGEERRLNQNNLVAQPVVIVNLPLAFYLRSSASWSFDLEHGDYFIPFGLGAGKIWKVGTGTTINVFAEPQYTVAHQGVAPHWQYFMGINLQFPLT